MTSPECSEPLDPATAGAGRSRRAAEAEHGQELPFELRGGAFTMMRLQLRDPRHPEFFALLAEKVAQAPSFFQNAPLVVDLGRVGGDAALDLRALTTEVRRLGLVPVAVQGGTPEQHEQAVAAGLGLLPARGERAEALRPERAAPAPRVAAREEEPAAAAVAAPAEPTGRLPMTPPTPPSFRPTAEPQPAEILYQRTTQLVTEPVRSGRRIYAHRGDLVVTAPVSPGAELLADGSIHVYGALRGRALAGASGDAEARIFCLSLEAELVSIAGLYLVSEDIPRDLHRRHVQILVRAGTLHIEPITT